MMIISHLPGVSRPVFKLVLNEASVGSIHTVGSAQNGASRILVDWRETKSCPWWEYGGAFAYWRKRPPGVAVWSWSHRSWCPHSGWWTLSPCPTSAPSCRTVFCAFPYSGSPSPSCTRCCALSCTHSGFRQHRPSCDKLNLKSISGEDNQNHQNYLFSNSCLLKRHCVLQLWAADLPLNKFPH